MYCSKCGKEIPDKSLFCMYCGNTITGPKQDTKVVVEYEYHVVQNKAKNDGCFDDVLAYADAQLNRDGMRENEARLHFWRKYQGQLLPMFQTWIDAGWQPITEIGPACLQIRNSSDKKKNGLLDSIFSVGYPHWEFVGYSVKFRKPK